MPTKTCISYLLVAAGSVLAFYSPSSILKCHKYSAILKGIRRNFMKSGGCSPQFGFKLEIKQLHCKFFPSSWAKFKAAMFSSVRVSELCFFQTARAGEANSKMAHVDISGALLPSRGSSFNTQCHHSFLSWRP
jgi:hypothetical protein